MSELKLLVNDSNGVEYRIFIDRIFFGSGYVDNEILHLSIDSYSSWFYVSNNKVDWGSELAFNNYTTQSNRDFVDRVLRMRTFL